MRLLLDTDILINYFSRREPFFADSQKLFIAQFFGDVELWASAKSFTDVFYVLKGPIGAARLQTMLFQSLERLRICSIGCEDVRMAARAQWPDFEDCLIDVAAQKVKADRIVTRDAQGFASPSVPAMTSGEVLAELEGKGFRYDEVLL